MDREEYTPYATSHYIDNILTLLSRAELQRVRERRSDIADSKDYLREFQRELIFQQQTNGALCQFIEPKTLFDLSIYLGEFCLSITEYGWWNPAYFNALITELNIAELQLQDKGFLLRKITPESLEYYGESLGY